MTQLLELQANFPLGAYGRWILRISNIGELFEKTRKYTNVLNIQNNIPDGQLINDDNTLVVLNNNVLDKKRLEQLLEICSSFSSIINITVKSKPDNDLTELLDVLKPKILKNVREMVKGRKLDNISDDAKYRINNITMNNDLTNEIVKDLKLNI